MNFSAIFIRIFTSVFLVGSILGIYNLALLTFGPLLTGSTWPSASFGIIIITIPFVFYLHNKLTDVLETILLQQSVEYGRVINKLKRLILSMVQIDEFANVVLHTLQHKIGYAKVIILLKDSEQQEFTNFAHAGTLSISTSIAHNHPLVVQVGSNHQPIIKSALQDLDSFNSQNPAHQAHRTIINLLDWLGVEAVVPMFSNHQLIGLILLGGKPNRRFRRTVHLDFLTTLSELIAPVLEKSKQYIKEHQANTDLRRQLKKITKELTYANEQLKNLDKAKSEFLSIASHQLYTPLTAIRGYLAMLHEGDFGHISVKQKSIVNILNNSADRLILLIKNLLDISRIESGRLELNLEPVDLVVMAKEIVQDLMPNAMKKKLKLIFEPSHELMPHVMADKERLRQVMLNFIDNAIKYTTTGDIIVSVGLERNDLVFSVTDTGKGIDADEISKIFTKFTRVGGAERFYTEGTGLGLYVAQQIVHEHHGQITVRSAGQGAGSTFTVHLPIEGSPRSLNAHDKASVVIKAAEVQKTTMHPSEYETEPVR